MSEKVYVVKATMTIDLIGRFTETDLKDRGVDTSSEQSVWEAIRYNEAIGGDELAEDGFGDWQWNDVTIE